MSHVMSNVVVDGVLEVGFESLVLAANVGELDVHGVIDHLEVPQYAIWSHTQYLGVVVDFQNPNLQVIVQQEIDSKEFSEPMCVYIAHATYYLEQRCGRCCEPCG